jgi:N-acetylglutamate synthase-like GNAT family acetyltransferase
LQQKWSIMITILPFDERFQPDITAFMNAIEKEFTEPISHSDPKTKKITELADLSTEKYWVAVSNGKAVGTIGLTIISNEKIVLKRMFISPEFRGKGIAKLLLNVLFTWANENKVKAIYLGTMSQFKTAHQFYEKNGFSKIEKRDLPRDFPINPVDSLFYFKPL